MGYMVPCLTFALTFTSPFQRLGSTDSWTSPRVVLKPQPRGRVHQLLRRPWTDRNCGMCFAVPLHWSGPGGSGVPLQPTAFLPRGVPGLASMRSGNSPKMPKDWSISTELRDLQFWFAKSTHWWSQRTRVDPKWIESAWYIHATNYSGNHVYSLPHFQIHPKIHVGKPIVSLRRYREIYEGPTFSAAISGGLTVDITAWPAKWWFEIWNLTHMLHVWYI